MNFLILNLLVSLQHVRPRHTWIIFFACFPSASESNIDVNSSAHMNWIADGKFVFSLALRLLLIWMTSARVRELQWSFSLFNHSSSRCCDLHSCWFFRSSFCTLPSRWIILLDHFSVSKIAAIYLVSLSLLEELSRNFLWNIHVDILKSLFYCRFYNALFNVPIIIIAKCVWNQIKVPALYKSWEAPVKCGAARVHSEG
jgi:hypothetical protein